MGCWEKEAIDTVGFRKDWIRSTPTDSKHINNEWAYRQYGVCGTHPFDTILNGLDGAKGMTMMDENGSKKLKTSMSQFHHVRQPSDYNLDDVLKDVKAMHPSEFIKGDKDGDKED